MPRPDILYILTDQQAASAMSCAGNPDLHTPAMDRIAARGVRFERAYCTQPLCVPSRASLVTGRYPHEVGVPYNLHPHECEAAAAHPWMGRIMAEAGYDTAWVGKWHLPAAAEAVDVHGFGITRETRGNEQDHRVPAACRALLEEPRRRPLLLAASFVNPHDCCQAARDEAMPNGAVGDPPPPEQCPALPANFEPPAGEPRVLRETVMPAHPGAYPTQAWTDGRWRQYRWQYNRLVEKVDRHVGELLDALEAAGRLDNTIIIFTSDHGDGIGGHRWNQKQVLYDEAARIPLLISVPGGRAGEVDEHLASMNLDLIPTLCDYAGRDVPRHLPQREVAGRSLRGLVEGDRPTDWRPAVYCETEFANFGRGKTTGVKGRMVRSERYKYIVYSEGEDREQLFDMPADPGEMNDLSGAAAHAAALSEHRELLARWCRQTRDDFPLPAVSAAG
ncbi:MAG: sulfatase-like hydrolase/transferase [Phycisphaeraceae bacterium]